MISFLQPTIRWYMLCLGAATWGNTHVGERTAGCYSDILSKRLPNGWMVGLSLLSGTDLECRFEVTVLTINWTVLIVAGALLSVLFKRDVIVVQQL